MLKADWSFVLVGFLRSSCTIKRRAISKRYFTSLPSRSLEPQEHWPSFHYGDSYAEKNSAKYSSRQRRREVTEEFRAKANLLTHLATEKFTEKELQEGKKVLDYLVKVRAKDPSALQLQLLLWGRLVEEVSKSNGLLQLEPLYLMNFLKLWKETSMESSKVFHPIVLMEKLQSISKSLSKYGFDSEAACIIMDVAIQKASRQKVQKIVRRILRMMTEAGIHPDAQIFERLLHAASIERNLSAMEYVIRRQINVYQVEPTIIGLSYILQEYCNRSEMQQAERVLDQMMSYPETISLDRKYMISDNYQVVLTSYQRIVQKCFGEEQEEAASAAERLLGRMREYATISRKSLFQTCQAMIDIYTHTNRPEKLVTLVDDLQLDSVKLSSLIKNFASHDMVDKASLLIENIIRCSEFLPNISVLESLIDTYAQSETIPHAFKNAYQVFKLVDDDPRFKSHGIRPSTVTFNTLLHCLAKQSGRSFLKDAGKGAKQTLDEMERRFQAGDEGVKPNVESYNLAIQICLDVGDYGRADELLVRMKERDLSLTRQEYNHMLHSLAQKANELAAEQADKMIANMITSADPTSVPDAETFSISMEAWSESGSSKTTNRIFAIYEQMLTNGMNPTADTFKTMIKFLCSTNQFEQVEKAEALLQEMETSPLLDMQPSLIQFSQIVKAWISLDETDKAINMLLRSVACYAEKKIRDAPSPLLFDKVLRCLLNQDKVLKATSLLENLQALKDSDQIPEGPSFQTYNSLRKAWKHSHIPDKEFRIIDIMKIMGRLRLSAKAKIK